MKEFQLRKDRHSTDFSAPNSQIAKESALATEPHQLLVLKLEEEDNVIIRHKPSKAAPVMVQARRKLPPMLTPDTAKASESMPWEQVVETAVTKLPDFKADDVGEGGIIEQTTVEAGEPLLVKKPCEFPCSRDSHRKVTKTVFDSNRKATYNAIFKRLLRFHL